MMAVNRFRLNARVQQGHRGAIRTRGLLDHTDRLLGVILLGNTLINTASAALSTVITARMFGTNQYALPIATLIVAFAILVISEATPKVLAANYADKAAVAFSYPLAILQKVFYPAVWFINLFVNGFFKADPAVGQRS